MIVVLTLSKVLSYFVTALEKKYSVMVKFISLGCLVMGWGVI